MPRPTHYAPIGPDSSFRVCQRPERKRRVAWGTVPLWARTILVLPALLAAAHTAAADVDPLSGIDFVRITHPGNAPWAGNGTPNDRAIGRGGVNYEYSIGRFEVTTSQWVQFFNAAYDRPQSQWLPHLAAPSDWGAVATTPTTPGGRRWVVPAGNEMMPTGNISWRMAAMYCNWLHNDKGTAREAFLNGAYDVSTFGYVGNIFTDQAAHHPDARYWIPTWDEWLKAAHFDPHKNGPDQGGWWLYPNGGDAPLVYGPPGVLVNGLPTQANAGWFPYEGYDPMRVPLGAYANEMSPWGLFDVAGGTAEWTESVLQGPSGIRFRFIDGSAWVAGSPASDRVTASSTDFPSFSTFDYGFRIASSVPTPSSVTLILIAAAFCGRRTRRATDETSNVGIAVYGVCDHHSKQA